MEIFLNGERREFPAPQTVSTLLALAGYGNRRVAIELNHEIVPGSRHESQALADGDRIEVIQAIGGG